MERSAVEAGLTLLAEEWLEFVAGQVPEQALVLPVVAEAEAETARAS